MLEGVLDNLTKPHHQQALLLYGVSAIALALGDRRFKEGSWTLQGNTAMYAFLTFVAMLARWVKKQVSLTEK